MEKKKREGVRVNGIRKGKRAKEMPPPSAPVKKAGKQDRVQLAKRLNVPPRRARSGVKASAVLGQGAGRHLSFAGILVDEEGMEQRLR